MTFIWETRNNIEETVKYIFFSCSEEQVFLLLLIPSFYESALRFRAVKYFTGVDNVNQPLHLCRTHGWTVVFACGNCCDVVSSSMLLRCELVVPCAFSYFCLPVFVSSMPPKFVFEYEVQQISSWLTLIAILLNNAE